MRLSLVKHRSNLAEKQIPSGTRPVITLHKEVCSELVVWCDCDVSVNKVFDCVLLKFQHPATEIHEFKIRSTRHSTKPLMQGPIIRTRTIIVHLVFVIQQEISYELTSSVFNKLNFLFTQRQTHC